MYTLNELYATVSNSKDKQKLLTIVRAMIPEARETATIISHMEHNPIYDYELKLEVVCKVPDRYNSIDIVDAIIHCADNTSLMKRLYNVGVKDFELFVAVNITDKDEIERIYMSGTTEVQRAVACNSNTRVEFLEKIVQETTDELTKKLAADTLKEISST